MTGLKAGPGNQMPEEDDLKLPGYAAFDMACDLHSKLWPNETFRDGSDPRMVAITEAINLAYATGVRNERGA